MQKVMATLGSVYLRFNKLQATHKPVRYARKKSNGLFDEILKSHHCSCLSCCLHIIFMAVIAKIISVLLDKRIF